MGINASKRVEGALASSPEFTAACDAVYDDCLTLAQHAFPGVRPYQLVDAAARLHALLSSGSLPLVRRWVPSPPGQAEVDAALRRAVGDRHPAGGYLGRPEFEAFAVELLRDAVLSGAGRALAQWAPAGMAGIAGCGMVVRAGRTAVGRVMGVYALGVATAVYLSLA
uniref:Armadillo repeat-containing protein 2 n=1 Tax=Anthurium amnicola TaxID=1678845 RepID=A0A1D1YSE7_9ARAE